MAAPKKHDGTRERMVSPRVWLALLIIIFLTPQISLHRAIGFGTDLRGYLSDSSGAEVPVGIAYGASDHYSYASWAAQAKHGIVLMSDLYSLEPHRAAFFNPFFIACGWIAWVTGFQPATVLTLLGLPAGPVLAVTVYLICVGLGLSKLVRILATAFVLFGTGPSIALKLINCLFSLSGIHLKAPIGIDCSYFDLFPSMALLTAPYQSVSNALVAMALLAALKWQRAAHSGIRQNWQTVCLGLAVAALVLVRPYQCAGLALCLPAAVLVDWTTGPLRRRIVLTDFGILAATIGPAILYVGWLSEQEVWHSISRGYLLVNVPRIDIVIAYSLLWALSALGIQRAISERRSDLALLIVWTAETMISLPLLGNVALKFADAAPIAMSILGAYGLEPWLAPRLFVTTLHRHAYRSAAIAIIVMFAGTTVSDYYSVLSKGFPSIDEEIVSASMFIDGLRDIDIPIVLTDCISGNIMPGVIPVRVYAGHFALTTNYFQKCGFLDAAGFSTTAPLNPASEAKFRQVVSSIKPEFLLLKQGTLADVWASHQITMSRIWRATRWSLYRLKDYKLSQ